MNISENLIPLDKSWIIRMGILDIIHGREDILIFLENQKDLSDDLLALQMAARDWKTKKEIDVGESGTLFRFLQFVSWKQKLGKTFIKKGTLKERKMTDDPEIVDFSLPKLLELDNATSQWASAAVLMGNTETIPNPPYKLALSYEAVAHWNKQRKNDSNWQPRYDETILAQVEAFVELLRGKRPKFIPKQAEDYCFARVFDYISMQEGEKKWPSLRGHESDRISEMETVLEQAKSGQPVKSRDHRAVQAAVMWAQVNKVQIKIEYPQAVNKSWPQFWDFIDWSKSIK